jgi:hypothetical protein
MKLALDSIADPCLDLAGSGTKVLLCQVSPVQSSQRASYYIPSFYGAQFQNANIFLFEQDFHFLVKTASWNFLYFDKTEYLQNYVLKLFYRT